MEMEKLLIALYQMISVDDIKKNSLDNRGSKSMDLILLSGGSGKRLSNF